MTCLSPTHSRAFCVLPSSRTVTAHWQPLPLKHALCLAPLLGIYRQGSQPKGGEDLPGSQPHPSGCSGVRTHFLRAFFCIES